MSVEQTEIEQATAVVVHPIDAVRLAVARFDRVAAGIADLKANYAGVVFDVTTSKGMKDAATARAAIRSVRVEVEKVRKDCKAPVLALGREIDARAAAITPELLAIEEPIDQQIKAEEARREQEKQRKAEAERKRVADLQDRILELQGCQMLTPTMGAASIAEHISDLVRIPVDASFQEFQPQAETTKAKGLERLRAIHAAAVAHEAEQERLRVEREELARQRAEQEQANIEARRRIAIQEAEAKRQREAAEAEALAKRQAEEAERQRQIDESMAKLRAERAQRERENAERAERQRLEDEQRATEHSRQLQLIAREQALQESRWAEINAMGHQVMIAITGRAGVRAGGTRECIAETLDETAAWDVTEAKFGPLFPVALSARQTACDAITRELQAWDANATSERLAAEQAIELAARTSAPDLPFDGTTDTGVCTDADGSTLAIVQGVEFSPTANDIAQLVSTDYGVGFDRAMAWCVNAFGRGDAAKEIDG